MNSTEEAYCSFEVSRLLKEKGFNIECKYFFNKGSGWKRQSDLLLRIYEDLIENPTHQMAIEWFRINHNIILWAKPFVLSDEITLLDNKFCYYVAKDGKIVNTQDFHNSPQEATEAALLYTLENLIP